MGGMTPPSHAKKHGLADTRNHIGIPAAIEDNVIVFDGDGLPQDSGVPIESLLNGMRPQGPWDASGGTYPGHPELGYFWWISVAGTLDGVDYNVGDWLVYVDDTGTPTTDWKKIDNTEDGKVKVVSSDYPANYLNNKIDVTGRIYKSIFYVGPTSTMRIATPLILVGREAYTNGGLGISYSPQLFPVSANPPIIHISIEDAGAVTNLRGFSAHFVHVTDISGNYIGITVEVFKTYLSGTEIIVEEAADDDCTIHWRAEEEDVPT